MTKHDNQLPAMMQKPLIELRRQAVARHVAKGMTIREIAKAVFKEDGIVNPETGKAFSRQTINNDIVALCQLWSSQAVNEIDQHKVRMLEEINIIKQALWSDIEWLKTRVDDMPSPGHYNSLLKAIEREADILEIGKRTEQTNNTLIVQYGQPEDNDHNPFTIYTAKEDA